MIARWLARRRDRAAERWHMARRAAGGSIGPDVARARRRFNRWDAALDLWLGER